MIRFTKYEIMCMPRLEFKRRCKNPQFREYVERVLTLPGESIERVRLLDRRLQEAHKEKRINPLTAIEAQLELQDHPEVLWDAISFFDMVMINISLGSFMKDKKGEWKMRPKRLEWSDLNNL